MAINDPQIKRDTRRDAWDRDYLPYDYKKPVSKPVDMNITPVYLFALFFVFVLYIL
mgnify:CR=1